MSDYIPYKINLYIVAEEMEREPNMRSEDEAMKRKRSLSLEDAFGSYEQPVLESLQFKVSLKHKNPCERKLGGGGVSCESDFSCKFVKYCNFVIREGKMIKTNAGCVVNLDDVFANQG